MKDWVRDHLGIPPCGYLSSENYVIARYGNNSCGKWRVFGHPPRNPAILRSDWFAIRPGRPGNSIPDWNLLRNGWLTPGKERVHGTRSLWLIASFTHAIAIPWMNILQLDEILVYSFFSFFFLSPLTPAVYGSAAEYVYLITSVSPRTGWW